ncbi:MAG: 2-amino-4-hydroxy-6-hydroxymethyldihydropteridine diphosphokinase [Candidatus Omnitrophota bacterium]|nr:MAG: 2-amino-4-hydroxy-6-hydroxymethyldihydropteridine diphosphokinase [Candidatus Omnitrophota bacterium]
MEKVFIGVGSNLKNRVMNILKAIKMIEKKINIEKISSFIETEPEEGVKGDKFLNGVISGKTSLSPENLLAFLKEIEVKIGRPIDHPKGDARVIDLDILFYGKKIIKKKNLEIPHPKFRKRIFVLKPFSEIEPDFKDPLTGKKISIIYRELKNENPGENRRC